MMGQTPWCFDLSKEETKERSKKNKKDRRFSTSSCRTRRGIGGIEPPTPRIRSVDHTTVRGEDQSVTC